MMLRVMISALTLLALFFAGIIAFEIDQASERVVQQAQRAADQQKAPATDWGLGE